MAEEWRAAVGFEPYLEVSSLGRVRSLDYLAPSKRERQPVQLRKGRLFKPDLCTPGYYRVVIKRHGKRSRLHVHRLVAKTFVAGWFDGACVDHVDGDRLNNRADNLEWVTLSENSRRQNAAGRGVGRGQCHPSAKLADADVPRLFELRAAGHSLSKIGAMFGVSGSLVHKITSGKRRAHAEPVRIIAESR